jgi:negative regulator of flagellin synthesis FlgM
MVKITGQTPQGVNRPGGRPTAKKGESSTGSAGGAGSRESVDLSAKEGAVSLVKSASKGVGEVDEAKVAELKAAIANGDYKADLKVVAERIIAEAFQFGGE